MGLLSLLSKQTRFEVGDEKKLLLSTRFVRHYFQYCQIITLDMEACLRLENKGKGIEVQIQSVGRMLKSEKELNL